MREPAKSGAAIPMVSRGQAQTSYLPQVPVGAGAGGALRAHKPRGRGQGRHHRRPLSIVGTSFGMPGADDGAIRSQYEAYPYPARDPAAEATRLITGSPSHILEIEHYVLAGARAGPLNVLVAGGGTGDAAIMLAQQLADSHLGEDCGDLVEHLRNGMNGAEPGRKAGQRHIDELFWRGAGGETLLSGGKFRIDPRLHRVRLAADIFFFVD